MFWGESMVIVLSHVDNGTGYNGRIGSYELLIIDRDIQEAIKARKSEKEIEDIAVSKGMLTLKQYGVKLILEELTTVQELKRVCCSS